MKYLVLIRHNESELQWIINDALEAGGQLVGGPFSHVVRKGVSQNFQLVNVLCQAVLMPDKYDVNDFNNRGYT